MHHAWVRLFVVTIVSWLPWALATPLILRLGRQFPPDRLRPYGKWLPHLAAALVTGLIFAGWTTSLEVAFNPYAEMPAPAFVPFWLDKFSNGMLSSLVLYVGILIVSCGLDSRARLAFAQTETARLNEGLSKAQLNALRRQIEPHFLFNALNSVAGFVREGRNAEAVGMIATLSDFLRRMLADCNRQEVPLREEMEFVCDYLAIAKARFPDRLSVVIEIPAELATASIPNLILQPLVENAIKWYTTRVKVHHTVLGFVFSARGSEA